MRERDSVSPEGGPLSGAPLYSLSTPLQETWVTLPRKGYSSCKSSNRHTHHYMQSFWVCVLEWDEEYLSNHYLNWGDFPHLFFAWNCKRIFYKHSQKHTGFDKLLYSSKRLDIQHGFPPRLGSICLKGTGHSAWFPCQTRQSIQVLQASVCLKEARHLA